MASLELQKTSLDLEPSPEPHQRSVGPDDAMAGDEEEQRVAMIGPAHSPDGFGPADTLGFSIFDDLLNLFPETYL